MGYYDGMGGESIQASSYDLARVTRTPVILIVDARGMSLSAAALVKGFLTFQKDSLIRGVIFNRLSPSLYPRMKKAVEALGVPVFGYVPVLRDLKIESRHLGLVLPQEVPGLLGQLGQLAKTLEKTLDMEGILSLAHRAPPLLSPATEEGWALEDADFAYRAPRRLRIGLAQDEAFCFIYRENLRLLSRMGAEIVPFSPLRDKHLPEGLDGLLLYGGYPELHARELADNASLRREIRLALEEGLPCMAECGGFMYLHEEMEGMEGGSFPMVGFLPARAYRTGGLKRFGYTALSPKGKVFGTEEPDFIPSHEFHTYDSTDCGSDFSAVKPLRGDRWECLHARENLLAGFPHFYYYAVPSLARAFLQRCAQYRRD